ncbi:hypothetical protein LZ32DRAFT_115930 [Colletotrichum eremochloae]|nr:hypothetical protein LZ32DRAFT_115930 [Colletotrichum eremochloae]
MKFLYGFLPTLACAAVITTPDLIPRADDACQCRFASVGNTLILDSLVPAGDGAFPGTFKNNAGDTSCSITVDRGTGQECGDYGVIAGPSGKGPCDSVSGQFTCQDCAAAGLC